MFFSLSLWAPPPPSLPLDIKQEHFPATSAGQRYAMPQGGGRLAAGPDEPQKRREVGAREDVFARLRFISETLQQP